MYVNGLSDDMFNTIIRYETGKQYKYSMSLRDLDGYDLGDAIDKNGVSHRTYGYGILFHPDGGKYMDTVKTKYSQAELEDLYVKTTEKTVNKVYKWTKDNNISLNQNQIDSIVCACYNFGMGFLKKSVCDTIKSNPNDIQTIVNQWAHLSDKQADRFPGLVKRRKFEAEWYAQGTGVTVTDNYVPSSTSYNSGSSAVDSNAFAPANVFTTPDGNAYLSIYAGEVDSSSNTPHTRIYQYLGATIPLDEMSLPLIDNINSNSTIDASSGMHVDASNNINEDIYQTQGHHSADKQLGIGIAYPLLRINDHYFTNEDITKFTLSCEGFLPTIEVYIETAYNDLIKDNTIKDGDMCSVFLNPGHDSIKSYRGDFQITMVMMDDQPATAYYDKIKIHLIGELFIPSLYNGSLTFSFAGTSRDALIDVASKLGLGFFFCDPDNTEDAQMWYSMTDGDQKKNGDSPAVQYIKYVSSHAWKNFESFFDCWIDTRYAICFVNVAQILGNTGLDEEIDLAVFNTAMAATRPVDGQNLEATGQEKKANASPQLKLLNNFYDSKTAATSFYVLDYKEETNGQVSQQLGLSNDNYYSILNSGVKSVDEGSVEMEYSIPVNADKLKHGYYVLGGPGKNLTYTQADTGSYNDQHKSVQGGQIADTQSDADSQSIIQDGNNSLASGNTNKFYETGENHNKLNNAWLKKKVIKVTVNGLNMQLMRGEKIPMMITDTQTPIMNLMGVKNEAELLYRKIVSNCTGWFMIRGIRWCYTRNNSSHGTPWTTKLTLTRREWPIPGYVKNGGLEGEATVVVENNIVAGATTNAVMDQNTSGGSSSAGSSTSTASTSETTSGDKSITTNGLKPFMTTIYQDIVAACKTQGKSITLTGARRWAADNDGNKIEGLPKVQDGNKWKFINSAGDIVWYEDSQSRHLYGEAIDFVNAGGSSFEEIGTIIAKDPKTIVDMLTNGCYMMIEQTADGTGNKVKHYHIGTVNKSDGNAATIRENWWKSLIATTGSSINYNGKTYLLTSYLSY